MEVIDAQIHEPPVALPWEDAGPDLRRKILSEATLAYMDAVGVDRALLFARPDNQVWADEMASSQPDRFASVFRANAIAGRPDVDQLAAEAKQKHRLGLVAWRLVITLPLSGEGIERYRTGGFESVFAACSRHRLPLFLFASRHLGIVSEVAKRYPDLTLVVDHLGLPQPPFESRDIPPFKSLAEVLKLATHANVALKFSGAPSLSEQQFPFADLWPSLSPVVEAFGPDRLMWGSDMSRFDGRHGFHTFPELPREYEGKHGYADALYYLRYTDRLSATEKEWILGRTIHRLLGWPSPEP